MWCVLLLMALPCRLVLADCPPCTCSSPVMWPFSGCDIACGAKCGDQCCAGGNGCPRCKCADYEIWPGSGCDVHCGMNCQGQGCCHTAPHPGRDITDVLRHLLPFLPGLTALVALFSLATSAALCLWRGPWHSGNRQQMEPLLH